MRKRPFPNRKYDLHDADGTPPWPFILLAGPEKSGKSWEVACASKGDVFGRVTVVTFGESSMNEYGAIPGVRFQPLQPDGTYLDVLDAVLMACELPTIGDKPSLVALDSGSRLWEFLSAEAQALANARERDKAERYRRMNQFDYDKDYTIGPDLWNRARARFEAITEALREHAQTGKGPSIITGFYDAKAVMGANGSPTGEKEWGYSIQKRLPADVDAVLRARERGQWEIAAARGVEGGSADAEAIEFAGSDVVQRFLTRRGLLGRGKVRAAKFVQLRPESVLDEEATLLRSAVEDFNPDEFLAALRAAEVKAAGDRTEAPLRSLWEFHTEAVLMAARVSVDGRDLSAAAYFGERVKAFRTWLEDQASVPAQAQQEPPAQAPAQEAAAPAEPPAAPAEPPAPPPATDQAPADTPRAQEIRVRAMLREEIAGHAAVLGQDPKAYTAEVRGRARTIDGVPIERLTEWVVTQRATIAGELMARGQATAAQALTSAPSGPIVWADIVELAPAVP